jgi:hypothetical protein
VCDVRFHVKMRRNACAQTNEAGDAGVMNYDVIAYGSVCRDVKLQIYRYFLNRFISVSRSCRRKRKIPFFLIFLLYDFETSPK